jgi:SAM-dependent methyltransferase
MNMVGAAVDPGSAAVQNAGWRSSATRVLKRILRGDAGTLMRWRTGAVRFGSLRRLTPISKTFGFDRGLPIDRYYIESFLRANLADIRGRTLEVADNAYTCRFGAGRVVRSDVLHAESGNPAATIVADLSRGEGLPSEAFDCIILTQTLQMIYDLRTSLRLLCEALKPGGVLLATVPGISQISRFDMDRWGDYWRFTTLSARRLFEDAGPMDVTVKAYGNVLVAVAFLHGLAAEELREDELNSPDHDYQLLIAVRAVKRGSSEAC